MRVSLSTKAPWRSTLQCRRALTTCETGGVGVGWLSRTERQLERHVRHSQRFHVENAANLRLEAEHGISDDPDWHRSGESMTAAQAYCSLLESEWSALTETLRKYPDRRSALRTTKRILQATKRLVDALDRSGELHQITSREYARQEITTHALHVLRRDYFIPQSYQRWNVTKYNPWFRYFYVHDPQALQGTVYRMSRLTRLVLHADYLQVRWMTGRILAEVQYRAIESISRVRRRAKETWYLRVPERSPVALDVSGVWNLDALKRDLVTRCSQITQSLVC